jgi:hypothetical protein
MSFPLMTSASQSSTEANLMSQLIVVLGQRPGGSATLADLSTMLSAHSQQFLNEVGGMKAWLERYAFLFVVSGDVVTLGLAAMQQQPLVAAPMGVSVQQPTSSVAESSPQAWWSPVPQINPMAAAPCIAAPPSCTAAGNTCSGQSASSQLPGTSSSSVVPTPPVATPTAENIEQQSAVQLRGLPFQATMSDINAFLQDFSQFLKGDSPIQILFNRSGRPSGFAQVQFDSPETAVKACASLHRCMMTIEGDQGSGARERYIEVFLACEMRPKSNSKLHAVEAGGGDRKRSDDSPDSLSSGGSGVTPQQIVQECRNYMVTCEAGLVLLSTLGAAIPETSKAYLKKTGRGLKQLILQHPQEFAVVGAKGQERICYSPASPQRGQDFSMAESSSDLSQHTPIKACQVVVGQEHPQPAGASAQQQQQQRMSSTRCPQSPVVTRSAKLNGLRSPQLFATPSNWGTPPVSAISDRQFDRQLFDPAHYAPAQSSAQFANSLAMSWPTHAVQPMGAWPQAPFLPHHILPLPPMIPSVPSGAAPSVADGDAAAGSKEKGPNLWLRGLPANISEQDLFAWFSGHSVIECIADSPNPVHLVTESSPVGDRLSMLAVIETRSARDAVIAQRALDGQWMQMFPVKASIRSELPAGAGAADLQSYAPHTPSKASGCGADEHHNHMTDNNLRALLSPGALPYTFSVPWAPDVSAAVASKNANPAMENCAWSAFLDSFGRQGRVGFEAGAHHPPHQAHVAGALQRNVHQIHAA